MRWKISGHCKARVRSISGEDECGTSLKCITRRAHSRKWADRGGRSSLSLSLFILFSPFAVFFLSPLALIFFALDFFSHIFLYRRKEKRNTWKGLSPRGRKRRTVGARSLMCPLVIMLLRASARTPRKHPQVCKKEEEMWKRVLFFLVIEMKVLKVLAWRFELERSWDNIFLVGSRLARAWDVGCRTTRKIWPFHIIACIFDGQSDILWWVWGETWRSSVGDVGKRATVDMKK